MHQSAISSARVLVLRAPRGTDPPRSPALLQGFITVFP